MSPEPTRPDRPERLVLVVGTGTEVGKTWVSARLLSALRQAGVTVAARKPAQSFGPDDDPAGLDSAVLGAATGQPSEAVCPRRRWYGVALAPPMAAERLGHPQFSVADLVGEIEWPSPRIEVGLVESAGGVRSPQAGDGDAVDLGRALEPDLVLLVADAGLGTINSVRMSADALAADAPPHDASLVVVLNRFDPADDLHRRNRQWLAERDGYTVVAMPDDAATLIEIVRGDAAGRGSVAPI